MEAPTESSIDERYIGLFSSEERKALFLKYYGEDSQQHTVHANAPTMQNPYDPISWPSAESFEGNHMDWSQDGQRATLETFVARYTVRHQLKLPATTATRPRLDALRSKSEYFRALLYGRDDLLLKTVPLYNRFGNYDDEVIEEVYNEVQIGFFLNELLYGYTHVLSIHFMSVLDWFILKGAPMMSQDLDQYDLRYHQIIVCERADVTMRAYLLAHPSVSTLRAILFQVYHAMETAWWTHNLTHNDLHESNIMMRAIALDSPLSGRHFVYKRLFRAHWWLLQTQHLQGQQVKIIDFGRNRAYVPSREAHTHNAFVHGVHVHDRLLSPPGFAYVGYPRNKPNRRIDVQLLLFRLLQLPDEWWQLISLDAEFDAWLAFCDAMIDWTLANTLIEHEPDCVRERRKHADGVLSARTLRNCPLCCDHLREPGVFIYAFSALGATVSDALDHAFFAPFRSESLVDEATGARQLDTTHVVVSFVAHSGEAVLAGSALSGPRRCTACGVSQTCCQTLEPERHYCSRACYEFEHLFGGRTVYR